MKKVISGKRLIDIFSLGILTGALVLIYSYWPGRTSAASFNEFPIGQTRIVEFNADFEVLDAMTPREKLDQMRDWLLYTAISSAGLSAEDTSRATFDLPTVRQAYLRPVASFAYGPTRSAYLGDGTVVALIPPDDPKKQTDNLAHIADEHRKNLGEVPEQIVILEYVINLDDTGDDYFAEVTRRETIEARTLFWERAGYYEEIISDLNSFKYFLSRVDIVTYAHADGRLILGGRKLQGEQYRGVTAEDVAAIWQSEERRDSNGSGFSLDPTYDFQGLRKHFDEEIAPILRWALAGSAGSLQPTSGYTTSPILRPYWNSYDPTPDESIREASEALGATPPDVGPMLELLNSFSRQNNGMTRLFEDRLGISASEAAHSLLHELKHKFGFQTARYDGTLQGTEVGMVLFYTDLLAKLWLSDHFNSTPSRQIDGFIPNLEIEVSSLHEQDLDKNSYTRLWFGKQDKGFQVADEGNTLLLDRITTRVYAAGFDPLRPNEEGEANIIDATFLEWWNSHYEEIARYEPQYQRLNEIMRWSLLIGWLNDKGDGMALNFLKKASVYNKNWFPEWANKQPDLRFKNWGEECSEGLTNLETQKQKKICFYPRNYKDLPTEALPLLKSRTHKRFGKILWYSGGVSLARRGEVGARLAVSSETRVAPLMRRANIDYAVARQTNSSLRTLEGVSYQFNKVNLERSVISATAKDGTKMRTIAGELSGNPTFEQAFTRGASGLKVETQVGGARVGSLEISRSGNSFRIGYRSRELDRAQVLAREMSRAKNPELVLDDSLLVEAYIPLPNGTSHLIKFKGADKWVKMEAGRGITREGVGARIGDVSSDARGYDISWVKAEDLPLGNEYFVIGEAGGGGAARISMTSLRPPSIAVPFERQVEGTVVRGLVNPRTGEMFIAEREAARALLRNPREFTRVVSRNNIEADPVINALWRRQYKTVLDDIARNPLLIREQLGRHLDSGLEKSSELLRSGRCEEVIQGVDDLIAIHGSRPELKTLRALARLSKRSPEVGSRVQETLRAGHRHNFEALLDEVNARLAASASDGNLLMLVRDGRRISLGIKTSSLPNVTRVSPTQIKRRAIILVEDRPGLNNLDWQVNTLPSLQQAIDLNIGQLYKVSRLNIAEFRPSMLIGPRLSASGQTVGQTTRYLVRYPSSLWRSDCSGSRANSEDCESEVYILSAAGNR